MAFSTVVLATGASVGINVVHTAQASDNADYWSPLIAGAVVAVTLAFVNEAAPPIASMLAVLFLLATILLRGESFFKSVSDFVGTPPTGKA